MLQVGATGKGERINIWLPPPRKLPGDAPWYPVIFTQLMKIYREVVNILSKQSRT
jgi:hypothetical protein